jgi:hypothetical protein
MAREILQLLPIKHLELLIAPQNLQSRLAPFRLRLDRFSSHGKV